MNYYRTRLMTVNKWIRAFKGIHGDNGKKYDDGRMITFQFYRNMSKVVFLVYS